MTKIELCELAAVMVISDAIKTKRDNPGENRPLLTICGDLIQKRSDSDAFYDVQQAVIAYLVGDLAQFIEQDSRF